MIVDVFPFFNELDLLEIRLHELSDIVDVFVLSEATLTFTGDPKPLHYQENKERYKEFEDRIHHVVIDSYDDMDVNSCTSMDRQQKQRGVDAALELMDKGDVMIMSDLDEIPRAEVVKQACKDDDWEFATLEMWLYYYYMNCPCVSRMRRWKNARIIRPTGPLVYHKTRKGRSDKEYKNAGWHFSFLHDIKYKIDSYTHAVEFSKPPFNTPLHIDLKRELAMDLFNRRVYKFKYVDDISYLPQYVLDNMDRFGKYVKS